MDKELYKQKLESNTPLSTGYILETINEIEWFLLDRKDQIIFSAKVLDFLKTNIDDLSKDEMKKVFERCHFDKINDIEFLNKLLDKSLLFRIPFIEHHYNHLDIFDNNKIIEYIKLLNEIDYPHFKFFDFKILENHQTDSLLDFYKEIFHSEFDDITENKIIPNEQLNLYAINKNINVFLSNELLTKEYKKDLLNKYVTQDDFDYFHKLFNTINSNTNKELIYDYDIINLTIKTLLKYKSLKNDHIISLVSSLNTPEKTKEAVKCILNDPESKSKLISILKSKLTFKDTSYLSTALQNPIKDFTNLNFFQYLTFKKNNSFATELCIQDKDFMTLFNNCLHQRFKGFDYENSPLDLVLKDVLLPSFIDEIYVQKIINKELKPGIQDKVCAFLFKALQDYEYSSYHKQRSGMILNAITLMPLNLVQKYYKRNQDTLTDNVDTHIITIINMLKLNKKLGKKENNPIKIKNKI